MSDESKPNPAYVNAPMEFISWAPDTGTLVMKETSRGKRGIRLAGVDKRGKKHVQFWKTISDWIESYHFQTK